MFAVQTLCYTECQNLSSLDIYSTSFMSTTVHGHRNTARKEHSTKIKENFLRKHCFQFFVSSSKRRVHRAECRGFVLSSKITLGEKNTVQAVFFLITFCFILKYIDHQQMAQAMLNGFILIAVCSI